MNLYILRHASAGTRRPNPLLDVKRPLDKEGKQHCLRLAHILNALKINFDLVVSSPLKRSLQTAQLVATETGYEARILHSAALTPEASVADFQRLVKDHASYENLLVVGHSPNIQAFLGSMLVPAPGDQPHLPLVRLRKGSFARLSLDVAAQRKTAVAFPAKPAILRGLIDPRLVRALYSTSTKSSRLRTSRK